MAFEVNDNPAVLNLQRRVIDGPRYLEQLVNTAASNQVAIQYLGKDDQILKLSYTDLDSLSSIVAQEIREQLYSSTKQNTIIPVVLPQHPALYVSYLAILKCGAAFCPVLPDTPLERLKFILKDVDATVGLCWPPQQDTLSSLSYQTRWITVDWQSLLKIQPQQLTPGEVASRNASDTAYIMYTSGSTGQPKGVPISHHAITQSLLAHDEHIPHFERFLQFAASTFDVSVFEVFFPFFRGSTLVCCERDLMLTDLPGVIERCKVDACELTPTVARTLLRSRTLVPSLRLLLTIGEMLNTQIVKEFGGDENHQSILFAMYGPTEATIHCTIAPCMASDSSVRNIGKPLSTVTSFILNDAGTVAIKGEIGELAIAGQLAEGYLNRDEATRASFVDLPGYGRVYKTGDLAMVTAEDELHIYGRISSGQVKIRGQRVELGEIEQAACRDDNIDLAVALVVQESIIVFCSGNSKLSSEDVARACKSWLPRHMLPTDIVILPDGFPRLPSGKVDRKLLVDTYQNQTLFEAEGEDSSSTAEGVHAHIYDLISHELGVSVHATTPLAKNGLDSLCAIRISSKLRRRYPHATAFVVLEADTVEQLILSLSEEQSSDNHLIDTHVSYEQLPGWSETVADVLSRFQEIEPDSVVEEVLPCSSIQIAMLAETSLDSTTNFNTVHLSLNRRFSFEQFMGAFSTLAEHTPILRCGFLATQNPEALYVQIVKTEAFFESRPSLLSPIWIQQSTDATDVIVTIHHAVYDGWSWDIIVYELNRILSGISVSIRPSFHDYVMQEKAISSGTIDAQLTMWVDYLKDFTPAQFPVLRPDIVPEPEREQHSSLMDIDLSALSLYTRTNQLSNASVAHATLILLLSQLLDTTNVTTGLVLAGRDRALVDVEEVIGPCLSTLPLRAETSDLATASDLIRRVHHQHLQCLQFSAVSLAQIKSALKIEQALFDVVFVWQQSLHSEDSHNHVRTTSSKDILRYSLLMEVEPMGESIRLRTTYDTSKLDSIFLRKLHEQFNALLSAVIQDSSRPVATIINDMEQDLLAVVAAKPQHSDLPGLTSTIANLAREDPQRIAVEFITENETISQPQVRINLTYKDLHERSKQIANILRSRYAMECNQVIAIYCEKSINTYAVICAALQAGVAYLCIDLRTPMKRITEIVKQANVELLLVDDLGMFSQSHLSVPIMTISDLCKQSYRELCEYRDVLSSPADLAYTVFTSGSTGVPKGVMIDRRNLASNIQALAAIYPYRSSSKLLQSCSLAFDVSVFEIFWSWHCGLTLCAASNDVLYQDIENFIRLNNITHLSMTPSVAALVEPANVPTVKFIVCSGEPMSRKVFEKWSDHGLHQGYGPSETTNICNVRQYQAGRSHINNVGPAFPNTSIYICRRRPQARADQPLDMSDFQLLPKGAVGEIWIGGTQVGRGYTDNTLTNRSWLDHSKFGKLYKSGDIGRLLADDSLVVIGRDDDQAKLRGLRIELNEINTKLIESRHVHDCYTLILKDENQFERLAAFWVASFEIQDYQPVIKALYDNLFNALPSYMIPEVLIPLPALPTTHQGKIDKPTLRSVHESLSQTDREQFSSSLTATEIPENVTELHTIIRGVLAYLTGTATTQLNDHASFFTYGIDSLRAIPFAQKLQNSGKCHVTISEILRHASVSRLAAYLETKKVQIKGEIRAEDVLPEKLRKELQATFDSRGEKVIKVLPCSPLQQAMLSEMSCTVGDGYVNHLVYRLRRIRGKIKAAWTTVVHRHEVLRTVFARTDERDYPIIQGVLKSFEAPWTETSAPPSNITLQPFEAPPYELYLEHQADGGQVLHMFMHHALFDAEAISRIQLEIEALYAKEPLPPPVPFSRYLDLTANIDQKSAEKFWSRHLGNVAPTRLAIPKQPTTKSNQMTTRRLECFITYSRLLAHAQYASTSILSLFQAIFAQFLSAVLQQKDICFGTVYSGRTNDVDDGEQIVGPCFNTLPVRVKINSRSTTKKLCESLQDFNSAVLPFQGTALRDLQSTYSPDRQRLFDIILLLQSPPRKLSDKLWSLIAETGQMDFPLIVEIQPDTELDSIEISVHSCVISASVLDTILADFLERLKSEVSDRSTTMHDTSIASIGGNSGLALEPVISQAGLADQDEDLVLSSQADSGLTSDARELVLTTLRALSRRSLKTISLNSDIYRIGLDSISAAQVAYRLTAAGYKVTTAEILEHPKISDLLEFCTVSSRKSRADETVHERDMLGSFDRNHRESVLRKLNYATQDIQAVWPCTSTQLGMLSEYSRSGANFYYNTVRLSLGEMTQREPLFRAWKHVALRHTMLRTAFMEVNDEMSPFAMVVHAPTSPLCQENNWFNISTRGENGSSGIDLPPWTLEYIETEETRLIEWKILHALYDAQSLRTILSDVAAVYQGVELPPVGDISSSLQSILRGNEAPVPEDSLFLKLKEVVQPTKFPDLNIRYQVSSRLHSQRSQLSVDLSKIQASCERLSCTVSIACQAAWAKILASYTGQQSVVFGNIITTRLNDNVSDDVVFPCINTLPIIVDFNSDMTMTAQISHVQTEIYRNANLSASKVQRSLALEDGLFDTVFAFQQTATNLGACDLWSVTDEASAEYVASLEAIPEKDQLFLQLTYDQNRIPGEHARILLEQYEHILYEIVGLNFSQNLPPRRCLSSYSPRCEFIPTETLGLHDLFFASVAKSPEKIALEFVTALEGTGVRKQTWSYSEVAQRAAFVAHLVAEAGVTPGSLIAMCFDKCPEASIAMLGILLSGCAFVAIDPGAPPARQSFILEDAKCPALLTMSSIASSFRTISGLNVIELDDLLDSPTREDSRITFSKPTPNSQVCYCLYTSGTTGTPKGCLISHRSAIQAMLSFSRIFRGRWNSDSRWLQFAAYHFDVSVLEHFWTWQEGLCVTVVPRDLLFDDLPGTVSRLGITHLDLTPSLARLLTPQAVPSLCEGVFIVGGEQVGQDIIETWGDAQCLFNFYGPSEVTIGCTVHPQVARGVKATNIGRTWDNVGAYVLKSDGKSVVLTGSIGELCLSGPLVGIGYLNRSELTAKKFVTLENGERIYRTGDLVRMLHDGSFDFLGRIDDQVKLRGQRLEIGEINSVLKRGSHEFEDAVALILAHPEQGKEAIIGFLAVGKATRTVSGSLSIRESEPIRKAVQDVRRHALNNLPGYMVPTYLIAVNLIPLNPNNKVDNKALKTFYTNLTLKEVRKYQEPTGQSVNVTAELRRLQQIISRYLRLPGLDVGPESSLIQLGVDSIAAIRLSRELRSQGYQTASVANLMRHPVIGNLCEVLSRHPSEQSQEQKSNINAAKAAIDQFAFKYGSYIERSITPLSSEVEHIAPCTALQQGMISHILGSESPRPPYLTEWVFTLAENINLMQLREAWIEATSYLDILRTCFISTEDGYAQAVLKSPILPIRLDVDSSNSLEIYDTGDDALFVEWVRSVRNLGSCLPWSIHLRQHQHDKRGKMCLYIFHGLYDGISLPLILNCVKNLYMGLDSGIGDVISFHESLAYGPLALFNNSDRQFWKKNLKCVRLLGIQQESLPEAPSMNILTRVVNAANVQSLCKSLSVTAQSVFHSIWLLVLARTFQLNPTIGVVFSGRLTELDNADRIVGPLFNTLPVMIDTLAPNANFSDLVIACHQKLVDMLPHQHNALSEIRKTVKLAGAMELFDSLFVYQGKSEAQPSNESAMWNEEASESDIDLPLNLEVQSLGTDTYQLKIAAKISPRLGLDVTELMNNVEEISRADFRLSEMVLPSVFWSGSPVVVNGTLGDRNQEEQHSEHSRTPEAGTVREVLKSLVGNSVNIGDHSPNIFELGLDSLDAIKIAARLKKRGIMLPVSQILRYPTVAGMTCQWLSDQKAIGNMNGSNGRDWSNTIANLGLRKEDFQMVTPVTNMQEGLLLDFEQYYNLFVYHLSSSARLEQLLKVLRLMIADLSVFRTQFFMLDERIDGSSYVQAITKLEAMQQDDMLAVRELRDLNNLKQYIEDLRRKASSKLKSSDISVVQLENGDNYLVMGLAHALYDGWSLKILLHHIEDAYHGGQPPAVRLEEIAGFVARTREESASKPARDFWSRLMRNIHPTILTNKTTKAGAVLRQSISRVDPRKLRRLCQRLGITMQSVTLAAWHLVLVRLTKNFDVNFGLVLSGRDSEEAESLIFPTFNTVVFRACCLDEVESDEFLRRIHQRLIEIYEHQHFPLSESLKIARNRQNVIFDSLFTFQKTPELAQTKDELLSPVDLGKETISPPYPVNVEVEQDGSSLIWTIATQAGVMQANTVDDILDMLDTILQFLVSDETTPIFESSDEEEAVRICGLPSIRVSRALSEPTPQSWTGGNGGQKRERFSDRELLVRDVLAQISGTDVNDISRHTNIFSLGLDSISAIRISKMLRNKSVTVPVSTILRAQSLADIAASSKAAGEATHQKTNRFNTELVSKESTKQILARLLRAGLSQNLVEDILPASGGQVYMLDMWQASNKQLMFGTFWLKIHNCDARRFEMAFNELIKNTPILRTQFLWHDGQYFQVILSSSHDSTAALQYKCSQRENGVIFTLHIHHALYDAVSLNLMLSELQRLYSDPQSLRSVSTESNNFLRSTIRDKEKAQRFWKEYLRNIEPVDIDGRLDSPRSNKYEPSITNVSTIRDVTRRAGVSVQAILFAAVARVYAGMKVSHQGSWHDERQTVIGVYMGNRSLDIEGLTELVVPTFNVVPLRIKVSNGQSLIAMAKEVQKDLQEIALAERCGWSLREIYRWTGVKIDCVVNFLKLPAADSSTDPLGVSRFEETTSIEHATGQDKETAQHLGEMNQKSPFMPGTQAEDLEWCVPTLDVEAKVDEDGQLAIGLFAPKDKVDEKKLSGIMDQLRILMADLRKATWQ